MTTNIEPQFPTTGNPFLDHILTIVYAERYQPRDRLQRIASTIAMRSEQVPVAWVRKHPNGKFTGEYLSDGAIEDLRKESGAWVPLYPVSCKTATMTDKKAQILVAEGADQVGVVLRKGDEHAVVMSGSVHWYPVDKDNPSKLSLQRSVVPFEMPEGLANAIGEAKEHGQRIAMHDGNAVFFSCDGDSELPGHDVDLNCPYCGGSGHKDDIPPSESMHKLGHERYDWVAKSIDNAEFAYNRLLSGDTRQQLDASIDAEIAKDGS